MNIEEQRQGAVTVLRPEGPIIGKDAEQFRKKLFQAMSESLGRFVLDASGVAYMDSTGLEALVDAGAEMAHAGNALKVCSANETVRHVLELTGTASRMEHYEDANAAVRSFL